MEHNSTFPIKQNELDMLRDEATSYIKSVQWEQGQRARNKDKDAQDDSILLYLSRANGGNGASVDVTSVSKTILALKKRLLPDSVAIPLNLNQTLYAIQEGLTLGIWIKDSYYDASGLSSSFKLPDHILSSFNWMRSLLTSPKTMVPNEPFPNGNALICVTEVLVTIEICTGPSI